MMMPASPAMLAWIPANMMAAVRSGARHARRERAKQNGDQAARFSDADTQHGDEHRAERRKTGEIADRFGEDTRDPFAIEQVVGGEDRTVARVNGRNPEHLGDPRDDENDARKCSEHRDRMGQRVAAALDQVEHVETRALRFGCGGGAHAA